VLICPNAKSGIISSYDFIDSFVADGNYVGPGQYDVINGQTGLVFGNAGFFADGRNDFTVSVTTSGLGAVGGVTYNAATESSGVGLKSGLSATGGVSSNNPGHKWSQQIDVLFDISSLRVEARDVADFSVSSANTAAILWESTIVQYLDIAGNPFSPVPTNSSYLNHSVTNGPNGIGTAQADSTGTVSNVGTDSVSSGSTGGNNSTSAFDTPAKLGITNAITLIGGVRFIHLIEDVRGINNGNSSLTATINNLRLSNFEASAVPEPSAIAFLGCVFGCCYVARRRSEAGAS